MEAVEEILGMIVGEGGALIVLSLIIIAWLRGMLYSKASMDALEKEHDEIAKQVEAQIAAVQELTEATKQSLETSKTILDILEKARGQHEAT